ncbi:hypothetical protein Tco_1386740 [Tanacetum coccineum]
MPHECLRIIESKSKVRNSRNKAVVAKVSSNSSTPRILPDVAALTTEVSELKNMMKTMLVEKQKAQAPAPVKAVKQSYVTYRGAHSYRNCPDTNGNVYQDNIQEYISQAAAANFNQGNTNSRPLMVANQIRPPAPAQQVQGVSKTDFENNVKANDAVLRNMQNQGQGTGTLLSNTVTNPKEDLKGITTRSGVAYKGPTIPTTSSPKVVERETEVTKDTMPPTNNGSTEEVQTPVVPVVHHESVSEPVNALVSASMPNQKASIPFPSRRNNERRCEKANDQIEKFYEIFRDLSFEISFTDALMLMPKFASTLKTLIGNKEKLSEMARTPLNENCSAVILNKLPKKLGDPGRFLIPCEFSRINTCNALADLGSSINLMPYSADVRSLNRSGITEESMNGGESSNFQRFSEYEEKAVLIKALKSHKRAMAWKLSDIKGIDPEFCTHKILMEEDYEPTVQHQRRVNPKIHNVIKKEVEKLLDAELIYPISDSPWVSPVHCVRKKGGMTVVKNDENDLIPTRLVIGWRVTDPPILVTTNIVLAREKALIMSSMMKKTSSEMADTQAEIILSQGLPRHIFNILNQTSTAQEIWNNVELLMQGSGRTLQQRKEDLFDDPSGG